MSFSPESRKADAPKVSGADAMLLGFGIVVAMFLADGLFKEWLYRHSAVLYWAFDIAKFVVVPAVVLRWLYRSHAVAPSRYGLQKFGKLEHWLRTLALILLASLLLAVIYHFSSKLAWRISGTVPPVFTYSTSVPKGWMHFPVVFYFALTAGFVEEIFLRGLPLLYQHNRFGDNGSKLAYVAVTSLLFGLIHWENGTPEIFATAAFGVAAAILYLQLRNLWPLIAAHVLIDVWWFG